MPTPIYGVPWLSPTDELRRFGCHVVAGSGAGKSRWLGRLMRNDFVKGKKIDGIRRFTGPACFLFDTGSAIDNFLHQTFIDGYTSDKSKAYAFDYYAPRIRYINMAGMGGYVSPLPILCRLPGEAHQEVPKRFVDTIRRVYPGLEAAQVQGLPPLQRAATLAGTILSVLGGSVLDMPDLVKNPDTWRDRVLAAARQYPHLPRLLAELKGVRYTDVLLTKLSLLNVDDTTSALYGALTPGIDLQQVIDNREIVLFDFRDVYDDEALRFGMVWAFWYVIRFLQRRGMHQEQPVSIVVDELSRLANLSEAHGQSSFARDLDFLLNTFMRSHNVWVTLAHQQMAQFSETIQAFLFGMRTQIVGKANDRQSALILAREMKRYDPYKVKETTETSVPRVVMGYKYDPDRVSITQPRLIPDHLIRSDEVELQKENTYFAPIEQQYENADWFEDMENLTFFRKTPDKREVFSIYLPDNQYAENHQEELTAIRLRLMQRDGKKVEDVLAEIANSTVNRPSIDQQSTPPQAEEKKPLPVTKRVPL